VGSQPTPSVLLEALAESPDPDSEPSEIRQEIRFRTDSWYQQQRHGGVVVESRSARIAAHRVSHWAGTGQPVNDLAEAHSSEMNRPVLEIPATFIH